VLRNAGSLLLLTLCAGCAVSRGIAPLAQGEHAVQISVGGPMMNLQGAPVPLPISSVGYGYGIDGRTHVHGAIYLTQLAFGVGGLDVGVATEMLSADGPRPRIMGDFTLYMFFGDTAKGGAEGGFRLFPDLNLTITWDIGKWDHHVYVGFDNFFQPFPVFRFYPTPYLGAEVKSGPSGQPHVGVIAELGYVAFWEDTTVLMPEWVGINNQGAVSFKLGLNVYFGGAKR
jgi:hypothetical protein